jgi:hypothetical protein
MSARAADASGARDRDDATAVAIRACGSRDGLCAAGVRGSSDREGETGHREARGLAASLDELRARERAEGALEIVRAPSDLREQIRERRGGATARETKQGAEDGDLGAHGCHYVQH